MSTITTSALFLTITLLLALVSILPEYLRHRRERRNEKVNEWGRRQLRQQQLMRRYGQELSVMDLRTIPSPKEWQPFSNVVHL